MTRRSRVLLVTSHFAPDLGGVPRLLESLTAGLVGSYDMRVVTSTHQPLDAYLGADRSPVPVDRVGPRRLRGATSLLVLARTLRAARTWRPDLILAGVAYPSAIVAWPASMMFRIPIVVYAHSEDVTVGGRWKRRVLATSLRRATTVIAVSNFTRSELSALGIADERIRVVNTAVDVPVLDGDVADAAGRPWTLLTVGRLIARKGQDTVIAALPILRREFPTLRYLIVGDGPHRGELEALVDRLDVGDIVAFTGRVDDEELHRLYLESYVFVMLTRPDPATSEVEGLGLVFLEANAMGVPVIAGDAGGTADAVVDGVTGVLVDPSTPDGFLSAVRRLHDDEALRRQMGDAGRLRVRTEFSFDTYLGRIREALDQAIAAGAR